MTSNLAFLVSGDGVFAKFVYKNNALLNNAHFTLVICEKKNKAFDYFSSIDGVKCVALDYCQNKEKVDEKIIELMNEFEIGYVFTTYDKVLGTSVVDQYKGRIYNLHLSLLPLHPGLNSAQISIESSELFFGASFHELSKEVDQGKILGQVILSKDLTKSYLENRIILIKKAQILFLDMIYKVLFESQYNYGRLPFNPSLSIEIEKIKS